MRHTWLLLFVSFLFLPVFVRGSLARAAPRALDAAAGGTRVRTHAVHADGRSVAGQSAITMCQPNEEVQGERGAAWSPSPLPSLSHRLPVSRFCCCPLFLFWPALPVPVPARRSSRGQRRAAQLPRHAADGIRVSGVGPGGRRGGRGRRRRRRRRPCGPDRRTRLPRRAHGPRRHQWCASETHWFCLLSPVPCAPTCCTRILSWIMILTLCIVCCRRRVCRVAAVTCARLRPSALLRAAPSPELYRSRLSWSDGPSALLGGYHSFHMFHLKICGVDMFQNLTSSVHNNIRL